MRLFMEGFNLRGKSELTGYEVADDFCYLNSPIVLANPFNVGVAYNAVLSYGFSLDRVEIWPPLIVGVNDSFLNDITASLLNEKDVLNTFRKASQGPVEQGSVGVGLGLRAYGYKGGIGTASRKIEIAGQNFTCGVLIASNHSNPLEPVSENSDSHTQRDEGGSFTLVVGVDMPLVPFQIKAIVWQAVWTSLLCFTGTYQGLFEYVVFALVIFFAATGLAVIVLRLKAPDVTRPYKAWGYPVLPLLFVLINLAIFFNTVWAQPLKSAVGLLILLAGIPAFLYWNKNSRQHPSSS